MSSPTSTQAKEIVKCGKEPIYFINKYAKVQHAIRGTVPFETFPFQDDCINAFIKHRFNVVVKARQLGLSTISAVYAVWLALFYRDKNILIIATKLTVAVNFIKKVKVIIDALPPWLILPSTDERTKQHIKFSNGSQIKAIPTSEDAGRSEALSLLIIDEAAFIRNFDEIWMGLYSTLSTGGRAIIMSTPNGIGGMYHKICDEAASGKNSFNYINLPWTVHPERDQAWFDKETRNMSAKQIAQEMLCDFAASGNTFISNDIVDMLRAQIEPPIEMCGPDTGMWIWEHKKLDSKYVLSADTARGDSDDYSAFHILNIETCEQVAEFKGKVAPDQFAVLINEYGRKYNNALVCPENNSFGYTTILKLFEMKYPNLYFKSEKDKFDALYGQVDTKIVSKIGFHTNSETRAPMLTLLEDRLRNQTIRIRSSRLIEEFKTFVWKGDKAQAKKGSHDDLVMSLAIGNTLVIPKGKHVIKKSDIAKAMLSGFAVNAKGKQEIRPVKHYNNMNVYRPVSSEVYTSIQGIYVEGVDDFTWLVK